MKVGFFEEAEGVHSATRLVMFLGCLWAIISGSLMVWRGIDPIVVGTFVSMIVGTFVGGKVASGALTEKQEKP
jgi:uncharacterized membrane protein